MATDVTPDIRTDGLKTAGATSLAWNATITGGLTNGVLVGTGTTGSSTAKQISTFQWDAAGTPVALTLFGRKQETSNNNCIAETWLLKNPASGTKQVKITPSASCEITGGSASYQFVNQTTPWNAAGPQSIEGLSGTTMSLTVTSATHEMVVGCGVENGGSVLTPTAGLTTIHNDNIGAGQHAGASADGAGAATVAVGWTGRTSGNPWAMVGGSLVFDGGGGGGGRTFFMQSGLDGLSSAGPKQFNPNLG